MKTKILFLIAFISLIGFSKAQLIISSDTYTQGVYNTAKEEWDFIVLQKKVTNVFGIMEDMSAFIHANEDGTTLVYTITNYEYDDESVKYSIVMQDDSKKEYVLIIDGSNLDIGISYYDANGRQMMDYYNIVDVSGLDE